MSININKARGFTLIELLVVIAIIGILSSVVLASLSTARAKSRDARRIADIDQLRTALEVYYDSNSNYALNSGIQSWSASAPVSPTGIAVMTGGTTTAISKIPAAPSTSGSYYYCARSAASSTTCDGGTTAAAYILGADLERNDNNGLKTDADATVGSSGSYVVNGLGANCAQAAVGSASTELCYDITN